MVSLAGKLERAMEMTSNSDAISDEKATIIWTCILVVWAIIFVIQYFLGFGTAYRCTKKGNDRGTGLFLYLIGFSFAALIPGLGLHYYIKHLQTKIIIQQAAPQQQNIIRVVDASQMPQSQNMQMQQQVSSNQMNQQVYNPYQQQAVRPQVPPARDIAIPNQNPVQIQYEQTQSSQSVNNQSNNNKQ